MAKFIILRSSEYVNRMVSYSLLIDGKRAGIIADGQTKEFEVPPGQHTVVAKIDWCSSPEISFTLDDTENKVIQVGGFRYSRWIAPVTAAISAFCFLCQPFIPFTVILCLSVPPFIFMLYYFTVGRKRYLTLT